LNIRVRELEQDFNVIFARCPKCKIDDAFVICDNCDEFTSFQLIKDDDGQFAHCHCDCEIGEMECECGTIISSKFFYIDPNMEREVIANKQDIKREMVEDRVSFKRHWFHWSWILVVGFTLLILIGVWEPRFNNDMAIGAIANRQEAEGAGFASLLIAVVGSALISWLPAYISYLVSRSLQEPD